MPDVPRARAARLPALLLALVLALLLSASVARAASPTVVSLTFDDGSSDQYAVRSLLSTHNMAGTFYVNSNHIGTDGSMTWNELRGLAFDGNEIAGHTLDHLDLTTLSATEAKRQVCDDRTNLINQGFSPIDFAYPYGARNATVIQIVKDCGYSSGRRAWGLRSPGSPTTYPYAETIPPVDPYQIRTPDNPQSSTTLSTLQGYVTQAENNGGGWVPLVFHHICDACATYSTSEATLSALLDWLEPRAATGTVVKTVRDVINPPPLADMTPPTSSIACDGGGCFTGWYRAAVRVSLSATDLESGVDVIRYTTDGSEPNVGSTTYNSPFALSEPTTVRYRAWDRSGNIEATKSQLIRIDTVAPTTSVTAPTAGATVVGRVAVTAVASDTISGIAQVRFYVDGSLLGTSTRAPYGVTWNTRKTTRGSHTLTAVARDVAGNEATSAPVAVTVR